MTCILCMAYMQKEKNNDYKYWALKVIFFLFSNGSLNTSANVLTAANGIKLFMYRITTFKPPICYP